jgi:hypothetical protein
LEVGIDDLFGLRQSLDIPDFDHPPPATLPAQNIRSIPDVVKVLDRQVIDARNLDVINVGADHVRDEVAHHQLRCLEVFLIDRSRL